MPTSLRKRRRYCWVVGVVGRKPFMGWRSGIPDSRLAEATDLKSVGDGWSLRHEIAPDLPHEKKQQRADAHHNQSGAQMTRRGETDAGASEQRHVSGETHGAFGNHGQQRGGNKPLEETGGTMQRADGHG